MIHRLAIILLLIAPSWAWAEMEPLEILKRVFACKPFKTEQIYSGKRDLEVEPFFLYADKNVPYMNNLDSVYLQMGATYEKFNNISKPSLTNTFKSFVGYSEEGSGRFIYVKNTEVYLSGFSVVLIDDSDVQFTICRRFK